MPAHRERPEAFPATYLRALARAIRSSPYFTTNTLNRDFVATRGFSVVFRADGRAEVEREFPWSAPFLAAAARLDCNAFYLNPLALQRGSRVDPHVDRSLRSYVKDVLPPVCVSVLYVEVPAAMRGGTLVLARGKRTLARVRPARNLLIEFEGDLLHSIERVESAGERLSVVCEQYALEPAELERVPRFALETRARY